MFTNPLNNKSENSKITINRLNALKRADELVKKETGLLSQSNKPNASFSKALNALRQEVVDNSQSSPSLNANKPSRPIASFSEAVNARKEKTANPFIKVSPKLQPGSK